MLIGSIRQQIWPPWPLFCRYIFYLYSATVLLINLFIHIFIYLTKLDRKWRKEVLVRCMSSLYLYPCYWLHNYEFCPFRRRKSLCVRSGPNVGVSLLRDKMDVSFRIEMRSVSGGGDANAQTTFSTKIVFLNRSVEDCRPAHWFRLAEKFMTKFDRKYSMSRTNFVVLDRPINKDDRLGLWLADTS